MRLRIEALLLGKLKHATPGLPCGRWHINGLARISARLVGRTEVACGDELQRQLFGRPVRKTPQWLSALRNPLLPATLRAPEAPPPCEPKKPPEHTLEGFLWYGHTGTIPLPLAAEPSSARDRYGICVRCLPFISVFGNYIPPYTAVPPKPDCRSGLVRSLRQGGFFWGGSDL